MDQDTQNLLIPEDVYCGVKQSVGRFEFICIKEPHGKLYLRKRGPRKGEVIYSDNPEAHRHYMVNRWPYREEPDHL